MSTRKKNSVMAEQLLKREVSVENEDEFAGAVTCATFFSSTCSPEPLIKQFSSLLKNACSTPPSGKEKKTKNKSSSNGEDMLTVYGQWFDEQLAGASRIEKHLANRDALQVLIDTHLFNFRSHYHPSFLDVKNNKNSDHSMPTTTSLRPKEVPQLLHPPWKPPLERAALCSWLGDWRPSAILSFIATLSSYLPEFDLTSRARQVLAGVICEFQAEEAVLDYELAERQANAAAAILFYNTQKDGNSSTAAAAAAEMEKIRELVARAHKLRYRAIEEAVENVLVDKHRVARFLVAFAGVQDLAHRHAARFRAAAGEISIAVRDLSGRQAN